MLHERKRRRGNKLRHGKKPKANMYRALIEIERASPSRQLHKMVERHLVIFAILNQQEEDGK